MVAVDDRCGRVASGDPGKPAQETRKPWVAPRWERLETPMEVTMYAGRR
jgi:hypothetical protein